jgi:hypothetical protein
MADRVIFLTDSTSSMHPDEFNELSSGEVLHRLRSGSLSHQELRRLIIEAEAIDFESEHVVPLKVVLRDFITRYRESNDPDDLLSVGAAIRKYVATSKADEALPYTAQLLDAGPRAPIPLEVELELVKMIVRKLTANPPEQNDALPQLGDRLWEIADTYLNPRLLTREKYGAIALNAILGLVLLRSRHVAEVLRDVSELKATWFRQSLARRSARLHEELKKGSSGAPPADLVSSLEELEAQYV